MKMHVKYVGAQLKHNALDGVGDEQEHVRNLQTAKSTFASSANT